MDNTKKVGCHVSILNQILSEEYERICRRIRVTEKNIEELPKGYISKKIIKGKSYMYYQWRDGKKVKSKYLKSEELESMKKKIEYRKELEIQLKHAFENKKKLKKVLG